MIELKEDNLKDILDSNDRVMVQYGAAWCGNCRLTKPKFKRIGEANKDIKFVYVDAEKLPGSRRLADIKNLPTFVAFKNGELVAQQAGNKEETIKKVLHEIAAN